MKKKSILPALSGIINYFKAYDDDGDEIRGIRFSEDKMKGGKCKDLEFAAGFLGITRLQTVLFAVAVQHSNRRSVDLDDMADFMNINYIDFLNYYDDLKALADRWLIRLKDGESVKVPKEVIQSLYANKNYVCPPTKGLNTMQIIHRFGKLFDSRDDEELTLELMLEQMDALIVDNPDTSLSKAMLRYNITPGCPGEALDRLERAVFYALCYRHYQYDDDEVRWKDIDDYFSEDDMDRLKDWYYHENMDLQTRCLIEYAGEDAFLNKDKFKICDNVLEDLFADAGGLNKKACAGNVSSINPKDITAKDLFYDGPLQKQVSCLEDMMGEERYSGICEALRKKGLRTGFTCLFYGTPGTGKTETVYQIARKTGRSLVVADVSKLKNCFVGESEKNVKRLFDDYRKIVRNCDRAPILLFNEADAIFGIRKEEATRAVDKMENSIQNIILQEMENLEGILIATTNLTENLDKAFERRFLYKVRFDKPSDEARARIWKSMIPELSEAEAVSLAAEFDFSGGQIENISRKRMIDSVIGGHEPDYAAIKGYCGEELILKSVNSRRLIGF